MRNTSDELCKEYGLSVIEDSSYGSKKLNYHIIKTYMNDIKKDIDALVKESNCIRDLKDNMKRKGMSSTESIEKMSFIIHIVMNRYILSH